MEFRNYRESDYDAVCDFLIELNRQDRSHINWNWARFEWMYGHPEFDSSTIDTIGLWWDNDRIVGAAIYDMYFGEAFCGVLPEYDSLYPAVLDYACKALKDDTGLAISICDGNTKEIQAAINAGFTPIDQSETIMKIELDRGFTAALPEEYRLQIAEMDQDADTKAMQWLFWQGFDHGEDREEFERTEQIAPQTRKHFNKSLSLASVSPDGDPVAYCCLWYMPDTDYAYVEPVCTIPKFRGRGIAKALIYEALGRAKTLGAKRAYVISDQAFYGKLGFTKELHYTFYRRSPNGKE